MLIAGAMSFMAPVCFAKTLEAGIEHSEVLAPVPEELQPGKIFHKAKSSDDRWAIIPPGTAGKWQMVRRFGVSSVDIKTGVRTKRPSDKYENSVTYIGYQDDRDGNIYTSADIESKLPHSNGTYLIPATWELKTNSDHSFTVVKRGVSVAVDPDSHVIRETKQLESFATFEVVAQDRLLQKYSTEWFNATGDAMTLTEGQTEMEKVANFSPVDELNGIDVKSSFRKYLRHR
jgi:hypothetical protein